MLRSFIEEYELLRVKFSQSNTVEILLANMQYSYESPKIRKYIFALL